MSTENKIALIIDCDNAKADAIYGIMEELSKYGETNIRRAYGNWKGTNPWEKVLHPFAIQPVQQFPYTRGKNATDLAMTIDAMEILFTENDDSTSSLEKIDKNKLRGNTKIMKAIREAINEKSDDDGWAESSAISQQINQLVRLSPRSFGYTKWAQLIRATEYFGERKNSKGQVFFRNKK